MTDETITASAVKPGDMLDLGGCKYCSDNPESEFEFAWVYAVIKESENCIVLHTDQTSFAVPPSTVFVYGGFAR